ncbi:MAG: cobalt ECF transporter T component CbiQ [Anaerovoracaceae bacterium]
MKSVLAVLTLFICVGARSFVVSFLVLFIMGGLTVLYSKASFSNYIRLMLAPFVFLLLGTFAIAFNFTGEPMDLLNIPIGEHYLAVSYNSLMYAIRLIVIALGSVSCLYFLSLTTPMLDLVFVMKRCHCPWLIVEIIMLMYRFIFVIGDIAAAIMLSQNCRLGNKDFKTSINSMGMMLSVLLMRALHKSSLLYDAMESRCYDGKIKVLYESNKASVKEISVVALWLIFVGAVAVFCKINGGI